MQDANAAKNKTSTKAKVYRSLIPLEPLFSMLNEAPISVLQAMLVDLNDFTDEAALEDIYQSIGITRREMLEQVNLAISSRSGEQLTIF